MKTEEENETTPLSCFYFLVYKTLVLLNNFQNLIDFGWEIDSWVMWNCFIKQFLKLKNEKEIKQVLNLSK